MPILKAFDRACKCITKNTCPRHGSRVSPQAARVPAADSSALAAGKCFGPALFGSGAIMEGVVCMDDDTLALWCPSANQPQSEDELQTSQPHDALEAEQSSPEEPCTAGDANQKRRRCNKRDHGDDHWKKFRKEVKSLLKNGIQTCCRQVENDLDYVTPTTDREKFVIGYLQTKIAHIDPRRSLPITEDRKLWDACMAQWKRQQDCKQTRSCTGRSEFFRAGMCKEPESVPHKQKFKQVNKAYWDHRASERQMSQLWAERNSGEDVGVPSTAGTLVSDQGSLPAPETPPKVTGSMADNERCATTPTLVCCKKDPPMSAVKERTLPKPKRLSIIGARRQRARRVKAQNKKPSTAGSDQNTVSDHQGGALHCTPNMEDGSDQDGEDPLEFGVLDVSCF